MRALDQRIECEVANCHDSPPFGATSSKAAVSGGWIVNGAFDRSAGAPSQASLTRTSAWVVASKGTCHEKTPAEPSTWATGRQVSVGPVRYSMRTSPKLEPTQAMSCVSPPVQTSPPFGATTATLCAAVVGTVYEFCILYRPPFSRSRMVARSGVKKQ